MDHAKKGEKAIEEKRHNDAIEHYNAAIKQSPEAPAYYIGRSTAYGHASNNEAALQDAERAVILATKRARREQIEEAQFRRAVALYNLKRYGDADFVLSTITAKIKTKTKEENVQAAMDSNDGKSLSKFQNKANIWQGMAKNKLKSPEIDDKQKVVTVKEMPDIDVTAPPSSTPAPTTTKKEPASAPAPPSAPAQTPASAIRHEMLQNSSTVTVTVYAKGIPEDKYTVDIQERSLDISFPLTSGSDYQLQFDPLFGAVDPSKSSYKLFKTKLEISLKKDVESNKWPSLEGVADDAAPKATTAATATDTAARSAALSSTTAGPSYPTSSKSGPKDWDKIAKSYKKPPKSKSKTGTKDSANTPPSSDADSDADEPAASTSKDTTKPAPAKSSTKQKSKAKNDDGIYVDSDSDGGDEVNGFFKMLYKNADPDTRRAMMKSYQESGGTALSTNWDEVSKGPVAVSPPEGMEEKKY